MKKAENEGEYKQKRAYKSKAEIKFGNKVSSSNKFLAGDIQTIPPKVIATVWMNISWKWYGIRGSRNQWSFF